MLWFPLLVLGAVGSGFTASGVGAIWLNNTGTRAVWPAIWAIALALHAGYLVPVIVRRGALLGLLAWIAAVHFTREGLAASGFPAALTRALPLQLGTVAAGLALGERSTWAERLARWRRARTDIGVQLRMWPGLVPWSIEAVRRLVLGVPDMPAHSALQQLADSIEEADARLRLHVRRLAAPDRLREVLLSAGSALLADAEVVAGRVSSDLQQRALVAAAGCRDECERLPGLNDREREALAARCEAVLMETARPRM